jgi:anti-sigma regulatory factor (Ser/Thr protein kinase)
VTDEEPERVALSMPADPELVGLARMAASVVASRVDLSYEEVDDLRLAIDELVVLCGAGAGSVAHGSRLVLEFCTDDSGIRIDCVVSPAPPPAAVEMDEHVGGLLPDQLSERILDALVDAHGVSEDGDGRRGWLWKKRPSH